MTTSQKLMALRQQNKKLKGETGKMNASMSDMNWQADCAKTIPEKSLLQDYRRILDAIDEPSQITGSSKLRERRSESKKKHLLNHLEWKPKLDYSMTQESFSPVKSQPKFIPDDITSPVIRKSSSSKKEKPDKKNRSPANQWESENKIRQSLADLNVKDANKRIVQKVPDAPHLYEIPENTAPHFDSSVKFQNGKWEINQELSHHSNSKKRSAEKLPLTERFELGVQENLLNNLVRNSGLLKRSESIRKDKENLFAKQGSISERIQVVQKNCKVAQKESQRKPHQPSKSLAQSAIQKQHQAAENTAKAELFGKLERFGRQIEKLKANFDVISPFLISSHLEGSLQFEKEIKHELQVIERKIKAFSSKRS